MPVSTIGTNSLASTAQIGSLTTASGSAPSYSARAWVNFNGTGTVAIRASGNVSSITDLGTGTYRVNLTTAMSDANYSIQTSGKPATDLVCNTWVPGPDGTYGGVAASFFPIRCADQTPAVIDPIEVYAAIFR